MNKLAIELISTAMDTLNAEQWKICANPHYNYRHDSVQDTINFMNSDIGKALAIMNNAWCDLFRFREELKQESLSKEATN